LGTTPAVAAGVANHKWTIEDLVAMMERLQEREIQAEERKMRSISIEAISCAALLLIGFATLLLTISQIGSSMSQQGLAFTLLPSAIAFGAIFIGCCQRGKNSN
jgi:hypothetical protein